MGCGARRHARCVGGADYICDSCTIEELPKFVDSATNVRENEEDEDRVGRGIEDRVIGNEAGNRRAEVEAGEDRGDEFERGEIREEEIEEDENGTGRIRNGTVGSGGIEDGEAEYEGENGREGNEGENLGRENLRRAGDREERMQEDGIRTPSFKKGIGFVGVNARSILPKMSELRKLVKDSSALVLAVC